MQNRKFKKLSTFIAATMLSVVTIGTTAFASPQLLFDSEEGIGIEVHCSNPNARGDIEDNYTSVAGGMLWMYRKNDIKERKWEIPEKDEKPRIYKKIWRTYRDKCHFKWIRKNED